jgi:hypothetical protein
MQIRYTDFNGAEELLSTLFQPLWSEIEIVFDSMPLYLKGSDQAGKQGKPIFDAVGTNEHLKASLMHKGWHSNVQIPLEFNFLGTDIDFYREGAIIEAQFSNYPFLLNNLLRSELFFKAATQLADVPPKLLITVILGLSNKLHIILETYPDS